MKITNVISIQNVTLTNVTMLTNGTTKKVIMNVILIVNVMV